MDNIIFGCMSLRKRLLHKIVRYQGNQKNVTFFYYTIFFFWSPGIRHINVKMFSLEKYKLLPSWLPSNW